MPRRYRIFPEAALAYLDADYGVCGEGEVVFPVLLERLQRDQDVVGLPGLYVRGGQPPATRIFAQDLDLLPLPEADLWASADSKDPEVWVPVQTRRGCPLECSYCSTPELEGTDVRMGFLLLGGPGETKESVDESLAFARSLGLEMLKVSVGIRLYPHTPLARRAVEEGVVSAEDDLLVPRFYIRPGLEECVRQVQGEMLLLEYEQTHSVGAGCKVLIAAKVWLTCKPLVTTR